MRILLLVLAIMVVAFIALPSSPVSPGATGTALASTAFASEVPAEESPQPINPYCQRYCHGSPGAQFCSLSPADRNGCHHINSLGNCIFTLCGPIEPPIVVE